MATMKCLDKDGRPSSIEYDRATGNSQCGEPRCGAVFNVKDDRSTHHTLVSTIIVVACPKQVGEASAGVRSGKRERAAFSAV